MRFVASLASGVVRRKSTAAEKAGPRVVFIIAGLSHKPVFIGVGVAGRVGDPRFVGGANAEGTDGVRTIRVRLVAAKMANSEVSIRGPPVP